MLKSLSNLFIVFVILLLVGATLIVVGQYDHMSEAWNHFTNVFKTKGDSLFDHFTTLHGKLKWLRITAIAGFLILAIDALVLVVMICMMIKELIG